MQTNYSTDKSKTQIVVNVNVVPWNRNNIIDVNISFEKPRTQ